MSKFILEKRFLDLFPNTEVGVVVVRGMDNSQDRSDGEIARLLDEANSSAKRYLTAGIEFFENPVVAVWREAFRKFKTFRGARASIENLLKRAEKGNPVRSINPLVDIYNAISLEYALPVGGEDLSKIQGDLRLTVTDGGDSFITLGSSENEPTLPGEVCYLDDVGAVCRCWNWREGERTMLTEATTDATLLIETVDPSRRDDYLKALDTLAERVGRFLGGKTHVLHFSRDFTEAEL